MSYYKKVNFGLEIHLKVTPNATKNEIFGVIKSNFDTEFLQIKVTAIADKGKANHMLIKFLAKEWNIPPSSIEILKGETTRIKTIFIKNADESLLADIK